MKLAEIRDVWEKLGRFEKIGAHTHIKGLGLNEDLEALQVGDGMVGQKQGREAAGLVVQMVKEGKLSGKTVIFAGPPGTGKTAIAVAVPKELGGNVPFIQMSGSEVHSSEKKKTEVSQEPYGSASGWRSTRCERSTKEHSPTSMCVPLLTPITPTRRPRRAYGSL